MKKVFLLSFFLLVIFVLFLSHAEAGSPKPGMTLDEFKQYWESEAKTPQGAVKCLIIAVLETVKENNKDGYKMWGVVLHKDYVKSNGEPIANENFAREQFAKQVKGTNFFGGIAASYLGGTPENFYAYSYDNPIVVDDGQTREGENEIKIFVQSGGKDMASPVRLMKNKYGYWKICEYSSLYTGVKPIEDNDF